MGAYDVGGDRLWGRIEGRRVTEPLGLALGISVIFSSGWVKTAGAWTMSGWGVSQFWMPLVTGALFVPPLALALWMLAQLAPPDSADVAARSLRMAGKPRPQWRSGPTGAAGADRRGRGWCAKL